MLEHKRCYNYINSIKYVIDLILVIYYLCRQIKKIEITIIL